MNGFGFIEYEDAMDARDVVPGRRLVPHRTYIWLIFFFFSVPYVFGFAPVPGVIALLTKSSIQMAVISKASDSLYNSRGGHVARRTSLAQWTVLICLVPVARLTV